MMKKLLLVFVIVLFSCSDNSDGSNELEPPKRIAYLNFENETGGFLKVNEISFDNYRFVINSDYRTVEVDLEKLNQSSGTAITLIGKTYDSWMVPPKNWKETINAVFREDVITNITVYKRGLKYYAIVTYN